MLSRRSKTKADFSATNLRLQDYGLASQLHLVTMRVVKLFYVYILGSRQNPRVHYTGITRDLGKRLIQHNRGDGTQSSKHRPCIIEVAVAFRSEIKARRFERYLKTVQVASSRAGTSDFRFWVSAPASAGAFALECLSFHYMF
jgi:putative endonuclease